MESILITGGAGYIGIHTSLTFLEKGFNIVLIDSFSNSSKKSIDRLYKISTLTKSFSFSQITFFEGDVRDIKFLRDVFKKLFISGNPIKAVMHFAGLKSVEESISFPKIYWDVNVNGTKNAISAAKKCGAMLVFYSSPEAFGENEEMPLSNLKNSVFTPANLHQRHSYGSSKYIGELLCQFAVRNGHDVRIVRPFNAYGKRLRGDENGQVVSMMINSNPIIVHGDGSQTRSFTWIDDVTEGFVKTGLLDHGIDGSNLSGLAFNIGSTEEVSITSLAKRIVEVSGKKEIEQKNETGYYGDSKRRLPDVDKSQLLLGWSCNVNLNDGLKRMWDELSNN